MERLTESQESNLQDFLDGKLEGPALKQLKEQLASSPALQQRLEELRPIQHHLQKGLLLQPSTQFVDRVMRNLSRGAQFAYPSSKTSLMLLAGVMVASALLAMMLSAGTFDQLTGSIALEQIEPLKKYVTPSIPALTINGKLVMNILIGINLVLVFIVLDRTILRPFFNRRTGHAG